MSERHIPVHPNLDQLKVQAKELLRDLHAGDPVAIADLKEHCTQVEPASAKLADAQHTLARTYGIASWPRLVHACQMVDAIWEDDRETVRQLILKHPALLHEMARGPAKCNWGPPMSYAANVGRNEIIQMLHDMGAKDHEYAIDRAALQSKIGTARLLHELMGKPRAVPGCLDGPAYTLSVSGTELMLELGAAMYDKQGKRLAPVDVVLETDSRKPAAKHQILELYAKHGFTFPDTPTMALHRGRLDLLEEHLKRDPNLLHRTFTHEEIYPPELGCHDDVQATQGTPLRGTTLLHLCIDYDEYDIAVWLIEKGMDVNTRSAVDAEGFGGHTALFCTVVSQPNFWMNYQGGAQVAPFTELLLKHGADVNVRASLRKQLHPGYAPRYDTTLQVYRDVTPLSWGKRFHADVFVSKPAMALIEASSGIE